MVNNQIVDHGLDLYGLGVLFYEMLYGKLPFIATTIQNTFKLITKASLNFPKEPLVSKEA